MKKKSGAPGTEVLEVVSVNIPFDPRVDPHSTKEFLEKYGFKNVVIREGAVTGDAPPWIFCTYVLKRTMGGDFEIFCIDQHQKKIPVDQGSTSCVVPSSDVPDHLELMVRGDAYVVWNIFARPTSAESSFQLEVVKKEEDTLSKIDTLKKMFGNPQVNPLDTARLIEEVLAEKGDTHQPEDRDGRVRELVQEMGISSTTLNNTRSLLRLHPDLQVFLDPFLPPGKRMGRDCASLLVKVRPEKQVEMWKQVSKEDNVGTKATQLRILLYSLPFPE